MRRPVRGWLSLTGLTLPSGYRSVNGTDQPAGYYTERPDRGPSAPIWDIISYRQVRRHPAGHARPPDRPIRGQKEKPRRHWAKRGGNRTKAGNAPGGVPDATGLLLSGTRPLVTPTLTVGTLKAPCAAGRGLWTVYHEVSDGAIQRQKAHQGRRRGRSEPESGLLCPPLTVCLLVLQ